MYRTDYPSRKIVKKAIAALLPRSDPTLQNVAQQLDFSARTLQRRLGEMATTHSELVDEVRLEMACRQLEETDERIADIAIRLGFADASSFSRAFMRWMNIQPKAYRRQQAGPKYAANCSPLGQESRVGPRTS